MKLTHRLFTDARLIEEGALQALVEQVSHFAAEPSFIKAMRERLKPQMTITEDGVAIIPVEGVLARKPDVFELMFGVEDTNNVQEMLDVAGAKASVRGVMLDIDSPGGFITGGLEVGDTVKALRADKPVVSWSGGMMGSLAYLIGSQASRVVVTRSSMSGSIGAYTTHVDHTERLQALGLKVEVIKNKEADHKAAGILGTSLTAEQRDHIQARIQASFEDFRSAVKAARPQAKEEAMRGQVFNGAEARKAGLVDAIGSRESALKLLRSLMK